MNNIKSALITAAAALLMTASVSAAPPDDRIDITTIQDNSTVTSSTINIGGKCYATTYLLINGSSVDLTEEGYFSAIKTLTPGKNVFTLNCEGYNETLTIYYKAPTYLETIKQQYRQDEETVTKYGENKNYYAVITNDNTALYTSANTDAQNIAAGLCKGTTAAVEGETDSFYLLSGGIYVNKSDVSITKGTLPENKVTDVRCKTESSDKMSEFTLKMTTPVPYTVTFGENYADLMLYSTASGKLPVSNCICTLVNNVKKSTAAADNCVGYRFYFNDINRVAGYQVSYDENNTMTIGFKVKSSVLPVNLKGVSIAVNTAAATGNTLGTTTGAEVNSRIAQALADYLTQRGAEVYMTGVGGTNLDECVSQNKPDLVVTTSTLTPSNNVNSEAYSGVTLYNTFDDITSAAQSINGAVDLTDLNTVYNGLQKASLAATRYTLCPSVQFSYGCMMNVSDYDFLSDTANTQKLGEATGKAVESYFRAVY